MKIRHLLPILLLLGLPVLAQGQVYKCVGANGSTYYTNDRREAKDCTPLAKDLPVSSIPSGAGGGASSTPRSTTNFPSVSPEEQRQRDSGRRQLLESELATEKEALAQAQKELEDQQAIRTGNERNYARVLERLKPYQDKVDQHNRNIEALQKEIASLR